MERVSQLFNMLDPFPFRERDLDEDAEAFIVEWARELPRHAPLSIVVHLPGEEADTSEAAGLPEAIRSYFALRARALSAELSELFRVGRVSLAIGIVVLALCLAIAGLIAEPRLESLGSLAAEGLLILGWVALWRPMEIFLYDWWPVAGQRRLYQRLAEARVSVRAVS